ncbi:MAG: hypothetical protein QM820_40435 [Minicystis sp.]
MANYSSIVTTIRRGLVRLSEEELRKLCKGVEDKLARVAKDVNKVARLPTSKSEDLAKATTAMEKVLLQIAKRKKFDAEVLMIGRSILPALKELARGIQPYGRLSRVGKRTNRLNRALAALADGTEAREFLLAVHRFQLEAHHVLMETLVTNKRVLPLLEDLNKHFPGFDFTKPSQMPSVMLTADVHRLAQSKLMEKAGKGADDFATLIVSKGDGTEAVKGYRRLDIEAFSEELTKEVQKAIPAKGKVSLEAIARAHHEFYASALPWYSDPKAPDAAEFRRFMKQLIAKARLVDANQ